MDTIVQFCLRAVLFKNESTRCVWKRVNWEEMHEGRVETFRSLA